MDVAAHRRAVGLLVLAALLWSLGGVLLKAVDWPPLAVGGARGLVAALFLLAVRGRALRFTWSPLQWGAALAYAGCTVCFAAATKLTTAANAILLQYTAPVWVALLGTWLLGERATRADWATIVLTFAGMSLFCYDGLRLHDLDGILLALLSGFCFGATILLLRKQRAESPLESIILGNGLGFLIGLPAMCAAGTLPPPAGIGALLVLGVVQLGLAYLFYARAIRHVTALEGVLIPVIEPILNPLWVLLAFRERPTGLALAGGAVVLGAVTWRAAAALRTAPRG
ncbi:MAG: DMT family transporter [Opitutaceae bacterium]|nr:DMT family transporter [Opitutaceae bacterium]